MSARAQRYTLLQIIVHVYAWSALIMICFDLLAGNLSANPIQEIEQRTGRHAITLLMLSLACTPLNTLFGWRELIQRRRTLGLYAFMYGALHATIYVNLDYGFAWSLLAQTIGEKPYILLGILGLLMLTPLAITSFDLWKRRLGKRWKRLHQTVYLIAPILLLHYAWSKKGDLFALQGDIVRPLIYSLIAGVLLLARIPSIRRSIASFRRRALAQFQKRSAAPGARQRESYD